MRPTSLPFRRRYYSYCRSSALIIVLCCLVLLTVLVVAFFASITTERQSAKIYANSSSVKLLADSVIDIVMGQIKGGTHGTDSSGSTLAWASQPGMIRTYNTSGQAAGYFKLYSWAGMVGTGTFNSTSATEIPPADWTNMPALYNDLNDPVSGVYPIVNPAATNTVAGFSIASTAPNSIRDTAPMPVQWLYVLQDGSLATATGTDGNTVTVAAATPGNPIVARIAFWTDDDTCKVNVNTAGGDIWPTNYPSPGQPGNPGSFWDTPRIDSSFERTYLALNQPVHGEFQRYPGHPATTYLTAVFPGLTTNQLYAITPRINGGGSDSGTLPVTTDAPLTAKTDRLYASVDELVFSTNRSANVPLSNTQVQSANFFLTAHSRARGQSLQRAAHRHVAGQLHQLGRLSHRLRQPPRLLRNAEQQHLLFPARQFDRRHQRSAPNRSHHRPRPQPRHPAVPAKPHRAARPGFSTNGETFLSKYPGGVATTATDRDQILTETFDYVRALNEQDESAGALMTNSFTPTTNGTYNLQNLPYQSGQITPIYDAVTKTRGFGRFPTVTEAGLLFIGIGQTTTTHATNFPPYALSNFYYPSDSSGHSNIETWSPPPPAVNYTEMTGGSATNCGPGMTRVQAALVANLYDPSMGYASEYPDYFVEVDGLSSFQWQDSASKKWPMFRQDSTTNEVKGIYNQFGGYIGFRPFTDADNGWYNNDTFNADTYSFNSSTSGIYAYPNYGTTLDLLTGAPAGRAVTFLGGTATFKFRPALVNAQQNSGAYGPVVQQVTITFPAFDCPVPSLGASVTGIPNGTLPSFNKDFRDIANRFSGKGSGASSVWITTNDCYRAMVLDATKADGRTVAALTNVPSTYFINGPNYSKTAVNIGGHGMVNANNYPYYGTFYGSLVPGVSYTTNTAIYNATSGCQTNGLVYTGAVVNLQQTASGTIGAAASASIPIVFNSSANGAVGANGVFAGGTGTVPGDWDTGTGPRPRWSVHQQGGRRRHPVGQRRSHALLHHAGRQHLPDQLQLFHAQPPDALAGDVRLPAHRRAGATAVADAALPSRPQQPPRRDQPRRSSLPRPLHHAGRGTLSHQRSVLHRGQGQHELPDRALHLHHPLHWRASRTAAEQILAIPASDGTTYKTASAINRRYYLDIAQTLQGFTQRFASNDIFRSASEICTIWLVPAGLSQTYSTMQTFWNSTSGSNGSLTGDNVRERPYANIYARLTTKSNTFTVHYHVETLKKAKSTSVTQWVEGTDVITGDYRGSTTLERFLDTSDTNIPDYATAAQPLPAGQSIDNFYKFRVIETKQFNP